MAATLTRTLSTVEVNMNKQFKLVFLGVVLGALVTAMTSNDFFNEAGNAQAARNAFASVQGE
jgi:hypothetical protein